MTPADTEKVLKFLMSKLSPDDLQELDDQLVGKTEAMASDSRFGDEDGRKRFLNLGPVARNAARSTHRKPALALDADAGKSFEERFPDAGRLLDGRV